MQTLEGAENLRPNSSLTKKEKINGLLSMVRERDYEAMSKRFADYFGLTFTTLPTLPHRIKSVIRGKEFLFADGGSAASRTFIILHSLGHYYFISSAKRKNENRYEYIYDKKERQTSLHLH